MHGTKKDGEMRGTKDGNRKKKGGASKEVEFNNMNMLNRTRDTNLTSGGSNMIIII